MQPGDWQSWGLFRESEAGGEGGVYVYACLCVGLDVAYPRVHRWSSLYETMVLLETTAKSHHTCLDDVGEVSRTADHRSSCEWGLALGYGVAGIC